MGGPSRSGPERWFVGAQIEQVSFGIGQVCNRPVRFTANITNQHGAQRKQPLHLGGKRVEVAADVEMHGTDHGTSSLQSNSPGSILITKHNPAIDVLALQLDQPQRR